MTIFAKNTYICRPTSSLNRITTMEWRIASSKSSKLMALMLLGVLRSISPAADFQMDVKSVLRRSSGLGFSLIHRDAPRSPLKTHHLLESTATTELLNQNPLKDVIQHVQALQVRMNSATNRAHHRHKHHHHHGEDVSGMRSPVVTLGQAGLEYYMPLQIGTPPTEVILIMDTGSDVTWVQCVPCSDCVPALRPPFNPRHSSSFFKLPCMSSTCNNLYQGVKPYCSPSGRTCLFSTQYADGSLSSGLLAMETIAANATVSSRHVKVENVTFGCANIDREGIPTGASGLVGMDRRPISFPSQMATKYGHKFSYCFPDKITHLNSSGVIFFGESGISPQLRYTPLLKNEAVPSASLDYYYVGLLGLSIDNHRLPLSPTIFQIESTGSGGTIVDSGTAFTYLRKPAFQAMRRAFLRKTSHLRRVEDASGFTPCYNITNGSLKTTQVPKVTLHLQDGVDIALPKNSILIPVSGDNVETTFCLAFQTSSSIPFNIIGNYQQQNMWIEYDLKKLQLGIAAMECAAD